MSRATTISKFINMNSEQLTITDINLYTLMPLDVFKALAGIDDREDKLARFCLVTSTLSIERYCKRRLLRKKYFETAEFCGDLILFLKEYPVRKILAAFSMNNLSMSNGEILEPDFYRVVPDCGSSVDVPSAIEFSPAVKRLRCNAVKVIYIAGYSADRIPADLAAACFELASWNFNRYRGRRIGLTGNIKGSGKEGEHFEMSMPENVRGLLEAYRRKVI